MSPTVAASGFHNPPLRNSQVVHLTLRCLHERPQPCRRKSWELDIFACSRAVACWRILCIPFPVASLLTYLAETKAPGIFGIPLRQSITYANVAISLIDEQGQSYIYGYVPIVVAKCGVFLKEKGTNCLPSTISPPHLLTIAL